jgi:2-dehydropantoate 2-reductase
MYYRRPLEIEAIFGNPLRKAVSAGVNLPLISCLYHQLKFLDARNREL